MPYAQRVTSTLKTGVSAALSSKTVLVGPNGSGKTAIVQALELATCGCASDMEGRHQVKLHTSLARLFPADAQGRWAEVIFDDGKVFRWSMEETNSGFKKPEHDAPFKVSWPMQDMKAVLSGDAKSVAAWLESVVVGQITADDVIASAPVHLRSVVQQIIRSAVSTDFLALAKYAGNEAKNKRSAATRSEKTVEQMTVGITPPLLPSVRQQLEARLATLRAQVGITQVDYDTRKANIIAAVEAYEQERAAFEQQVDPSTSGNVRQVTTALRLAEEHARTCPGAMCWVCGTEHEAPTPITDWVATLRDAARDVQDAIDRAAAYQTRKQDLATREQALQIAVESFNKLVVAPDTRAEQADIERQLQADTAAKQLWANADAARADIADARRQADMLTEAAKALTETGKRFLTQRKKHFEDRVTAFLPNGEIFGVDLDTARVGIWRGGELHSAVSGAEWSRLLLAITAALSDGSPAILVPEDRSWDPVTLASVMQALQHAPCQVIIMSAVAPDPVEGWTMVDLG